MNDGAPAHGQARPIVGGGGRTYVIGCNRPEDRQCPTPPWLQTPGISRPLLILAAAGGLLFAGTVALWAHYGTAVFFETIAAGIAACL